MAGAVARRQQGEQLDLFGVLREAGAIEATRLDLSPLFAGIDPASDEWFERYEDFGRALGMIHRSAKWWLADWLNFGEGTIGDRVYQAAEATGLAEGYLRNIMWVGRSVTPSRRKEGVPFSIHETVAPLPPDAQRHWLGVAAKVNPETKEKWTQRDLRHAIRKVLDAGDHDDGEPGGDRHDQERRPLDARRILEVGRQCAAVATKNGSVYEVPEEQWTQFLAAIGAGE